VRIEAVVFDIGGVLEITPATGWRDRWAAKLHIRPSDIEGRLGPTFAGGATGALSLDGVERAVRTELGLDDQQLAAFMSDLWAEYLGSLNEPLAAYFAALRPRYRTGILSNSFVGAREREQERYGLGELCDTIVYSHEEGMIKPDVRFYRIACERLKTVPERCVFLDDVQLCVDGARAAGMRAIKFETTEQAISELESVLENSRAVGAAGPTGNVCP
jgi:putative hydrolase of the HAD superfamily